MSAGSNHDAPAPIAAKPTHEGTEHSFDWHGALQGRRIFSFNNTSYSYSSGPGTVKLEGQKELLPRYTATGIEIAIRVCAVVFHCLLMDRRTLQQNQKSRPQMMGATAYQ